MTRRPVGHPEVVAPADESTLAGQFQLRCRELTREIIKAGFVPAGWIGMINTKGAVEAAKDLWHLVKSSPSPPGW